MFGVAESYLRAQHAQLPEPLWYCLKQNFLDKFCGLNVKRKKKACSLPSQWSRQLYSPGFSSTKTGILYLQPSRCWFLGIEGDIFIFVSAKLENNGRKQHRGKASLRDLLYDSEESSSRCTVRYSPPFVFPGVLVLGRPVHTKTRGYSSPFYNIKWLYYTWLLNTWDVAWTAEERNFTWL